MSQQRLAHAEAAEAAVLTLLMASVPTSFDVHLPQLKYPQEHLVREHQRRLQAGSQ